MNNTSSQIQEAEHALFTWLRQRPVNLRDLPQDFCGEWLPIDTSTWQKQGINTDQLSTLIWLAQDCLQKNAPVKAFYRRLKGKGPDWLTANPWLQTWPHCQGKIAPPQIDPIVRAALRWWLAPVFCITPATSPTLTTTNQSFLAFCEQDLHLSHESAPLPLEGRKDVIIHHFSNPNGVSHTALQFGKIPQNEEVLLRLHSQCQTGDVFHSLRCDCGQQLQHAMRLMRAAPSGLLLYMHEEGRAIGLHNKVKAYRIQHHQSIDTFDANHYLGFVWDNRNFYEASLILKQLKVMKVRMLTNNPDKIKRLQDAGITVTRQALKPPLARQTEPYRSTKSKRAGHL